jgi:dienelactone hydrolase
MYEPVDTKNPQFEVKRHGFAAGIALYPSCGAPYGSWATQRASGDTGPPIGHSGVFKPIAPLLILVGEKDDWTPAQPCEWLADVARQHGYPVELKVYAGAYHSFDSNAAMRYDPQRTNSMMVTGRGATTGGDPAAWADAKLRVRDFLARYLKPAP